MCQCFERDPAWQGWEHWYFGYDETFDDVPAPAPEVPHEQAAALPSAAIREPALH